jgi:hypothetical protein
MIDIIAGLQVLNVSTSSTTSSPLVTLGDHLNQNSESDSAQWIQSVGFCSLPSNPPQPSTAPTNGVAPTWSRTTETWGFRAGQRDFVIASRDVNSQAVYGNLGPGEFCVYAAGNSGTSQGRIIGKTDGSITLYTTDDNTSSGNAIYLRIGTDGLSFTSPFGSLSLGASGFHVVLDGGSAFHLGGNNSNPSTPAVCSINTGSIALAAPAITMGITPIFGLAYGFIPPPAPGTPILGEGVGAVTVNAAASTSIMVSP